MKTPDYHNPQQVPESALNPGERFLLREEVGNLDVYGKCQRWLGERWHPGPNGGIMKDFTYKTSLPLPPEYREPNYSDPEYRKSVEQAFRDGKRVQYKVEHRGDKWLTIGEVGNDQEPYWSWSDSVSYRIHPNDIDKAIDWCTPEKQAEVRRMWAENPAMERECKSKNGRDGWAKIAPGETWRGSEYYYRPAQKPREKSQREVDQEWFEKSMEARDVEPCHEEVWHTACAYAREASSKGVA